MWRPWGCSRDETCSLRRAGIPMDFPTRSVSSKKGEPDWQLPHSFGEVNP
jgi:hypothetical protein